MGVGAPEGVRAGGAPKRPGGGAGAKAEAGKTAPLTSLGDRKSFFPILAGAQDGWQLRWGFLGNHQLRRARGTLRRCPCRSLWTPGTALTATVAAAHKRGGHGGAGQRRGVRRAQRRHRPAAPVRGLLPGSARHQRSATSFLDTHLLSQRDSQLPSKVCASVQGNSICGPGWWPGAAPLTLELFQQAPGLWGRRGKCWGASAPLTSHLGRLRPLNDTRVITKRFP